MQQLRTQFFLISIVGSFFFLMLYGFFPFLRKPLVRENNILEMLQVLLYVAAIWRGLGNLSEFPKGWIRKFHMLIPLVGVVCVLEEISYGATFLPIYKIFSGRSPRVDGIKMDALHDVLELFYVWWGSVVIWGLALFLGISLVIVTSVVLLKMKKGPIEATQMVFRYFPFLEFFVLCAMGLVVALILDLDTQGISLISLFEELLEMVAALALFYAARAIPHSPVKFQLAK